MMQIKTLLGFLTENKIEPRIEKECVAVQFISTLKHDRVSL